MSSNVTDSGNVGGRRGAIKKQWDDFTAFLWDPQKRTVMGRTGNSWAKIMVFYLFYYGFLACLFAISVTIVLNSLDEYTPRYQTRLQTPGVAVQPKIPSNKDQTSDIFFNPADEKTYKILKEQLDEFFKPYNETLQENTDLYETCDEDKPPSKSQDYDPGQIAKACAFPMKHLGPCMDADNSYGYADGQPCIFVKLNRIINWLPVGYTDLSKAIGNDDSDAPPLSVLLQEYGRVYKPYLLYTFCYGAKEEDEKYLSGGDRTTIKYYPTDNGLPFGYYPYLGKNRQPQYLSPLVAVKFTNATRGKEINVRCKAYALNIRDSKDMAEGFFSFKLKIEESSA